MRLIDADKAIESMKKARDWHSDSCKTENHYNRCITIIEKQPIAYRVDKVVEQINACVEWDGYTVDIRNRIIEIVKKGGIE